MVMAILTLRPDAAGDETNITVQYPSSGEHWDKLDEEVADNFATHLDSKSLDYQRDLYNLPAHTTESGIINHIKIYFRIRSGSLTTTAYAEPSQKSGAVVTDGEEQSVYGSTWTTLSQTYTTNPATGLAYTWDEIDSLQVGISIKSDSETYGAQPTQVYVEIDYTATYTASLSSAMGMTSSVSRMADFSRSFTTSIGLQSLLAWGGRLKRQLKAAGTNRINSQVGTNRTLSQTGTNRNNAQVGTNRTVAQVGTNRERK
jgi:hypothetical protein